MHTKRRIHDGIAGAVVVCGVAMGHYLDPAWLWVPAILGLTLIQSAFTGFCPVYFILDRTCPMEAADSQS